MVNIKLSGVMVEDQDVAREFYTQKLGLEVNKDIPLGEANWLTVSTPGVPDFELLLEPLGFPQ